MNSYQAIVLMFAVTSTAFSCSGSREKDFESVSRPITSTPGTPGYLSSTRGTRSLISPKRQFVTYIAAAKRLTVIDQATESEAYSLQYPGSVLTAFPIASFDGIGSLNAAGLTVFSGGAQRNFAFSFVGLPWDIALNAPAFAFAMNNGVQVIRHLEADQWQNDTLPGLTQPATDVPLLSSDGLAMILVRPADGRYASYRAKQVNSPMTQILSCEPETTTKLPLVALVTQGSRLLWATQSGELGVIDFSMEACESLTPLVKLDPANEVARILPRGDNSILVFTIGGSVYQWDGATTINEFTKLDDCDFPLAPVALPDDDLASLCLSDLAQPIQTDQIRYRRASYRYFRKSQPGMQFAAVSSLDNLDRVAADPPSKRFFFFDPTALGRLVVVDLASNQTRERKGVFVKNILNR